MRSGHQRRDADFECEIRSHLILETDRLMAEGLNPEDARLAARRAFGNVTERKSISTRRNRFYTELWGALPRGRRDFHRVCRVGDKRDRVAADGQASAD